MTKKTSEDRFFNDLFWFILMWLCFIAAWVWDGEIKISGWAERITHEQGQTPISDATERIPEHRI